MFFKGGNLGKIDTLFQQRRHIEASGTFLELTRLGKAETKPNRKGRWIVYTICIIS